MTTTRDDWSKIYQAVHELTDRSIPPEKRKGIWISSPWVGDGLYLVDQLSIRWQGDPKDLGSVIVSVHGVYVEHGTERGILMEDVVSARQVEWRGLHGWHFVTRLEAANPPVEHIVKPLEPSDDPLSAYIVVEGMANGRVVLYTAEGERGAIEYLKDQGIPPQHFVAKVTKRTVDGKIVDVVDAPRPAWATKSGQAQEASVKCQEPSRSSDEPKSEHPRQYFVVSAHYLTGLAFDGIVRASTWTEEVALRRAKELAKSERDRAIYVCVATKRILPPSDSTVVDLT